MLVAPEVCRRKFDHEVERVMARAAALAHRGCIVLAASFPRIDVLFMPAKPLRASFQLPSTGMLVLPAGAMATADVPMLSARPFAVRFGLDDFDVLPPSVMFLDPFTRAPIAKDHLARGLLVTEQKQAQLVVLDDHPTYKRPFLCVRGTREYHQHPQHTGDDWFLYRRYIGLQHLIEVILRTMVDTTIAHLLALAGQLQVRWEVEVPP